MPLPLYGLPKQHYHHHHQIIAPTADRVFYASPPHHVPQNVYSALGGNNERLIFSSNHHHHHRDSSNNPTAAAATAVFNIPRKVIPLPVSKRSRTLPDAEQDSRPHSYHHHHDAQHQFSHAHPEYSTPSISPPRMQPHSHDTRPGTMKVNPASGLLDPCHICHRKPTRKSDLDSFADCMGCGQRTCYVCIRQCQGWLVGGSSPTTEDGRPPPQPDTSEQQQQEDLSASFTMRDVDDDIIDDQASPTIESQRRPSPGRRVQNNTNNKNGTGPGDPGPGDPRPDEGWSGRGHREVICSGCCVERGSEGDVVCLGCLAGMEGV